MAEDPFGGGRKDRTMKFSILVASIPERFATFLKPLVFKLIQQTNGRPDVEFIVCIDNKKRMIGEKRNDLLQMANGEYIAFIDDDDTVSSDYVDSIMQALKANPGVDVVTFDQDAKFDNGNSFLVHFDLKNKGNDPAHQKGGKWQDINRPPWHMCVWRSELAKREQFPHIKFSEDWQWCEKVLKHVKTQARIPKVLHIYRYVRAVSVTPENVKR